MAGERKSEDGFSATGDDTGLGIRRIHQVDCGKLPTDASEGRTHPPVPQTFGRG